MDLCHNGDFKTNPIRSRWFPLALSSLVPIPSVPSSLRFLRFCFPRFHRCHTMALRKKLYLQNEPI